MVGGAKEVGDDHARLTRKSTWALMAGGCCNRSRHAIRNLLMRAGGVIGSQSYPNCFESVGKAINDAHSKTRPRQARIPTIRLPKPSRDRAISPPSVRLPKPCYFSVQNPMYPGTSIHAVKYVSVNYTIRSSVPVTALIARSMVSGPTSSASPALRQV